VPKDSLAKRMKILIVASSLANGGAESHVLRVIEGMAELCEVVVANLGAFEPTTINYRGSHEVRVYPLCWVGARDYAGAARRLRAAVQLERPTCIYSYGRCANVVSIFCLMGYPSRPALAVGMNENFTFSFVGISIWRWALVGFWRAAEAILYRRADAVLTNSMETATVYTRYLRYPARRVSLVKNPIPSGWLSKLQVESATGRIDKIVVAGRMVAGKGMHDALKIFEGVSSKDPDLMLHFLGQGPLRKSLETYVDCRPALKGRVVFEGWVDVTHFLGPKTILLFTSYHEGQPNIVLEALAHGSLVVSYRNCGWIAWLEERGALVSAEVGAWATLGNLLTAILVDPDRRATQWASAKIAVQEFSAEDVVATRYSLLSALSQDLGRNE
jgi:glycosyltransferase involved in cell wall biosynthesis